ncbi:UDP-N-acetylmuramoyl-L-alanyl-D-glutamate--2,6-diaminopimelate ligase [Calditrichota bacterium]
MATDAGNVLSNIEIVKQVGDLPATLTGINQDSRRIQPGYVFAARKGYKTDGLKFLPQAVKRGAVLLITENEIPIDAGIPAIQVKDYRHALTLLSHELFGNPTRDLEIIGITGTNGKTSSTYLVRSILEAAGLKSGLIGTLGYDDGEDFGNVGMTTPDVDALCEMFRRMIDNHCTHTVMEVSSHGLRQGRVAGIRFGYAGFTNLTLDHLDFHTDMQDYADAKAELFRMVNKQGTSVINLDDDYAGYMKAESAAPVVSYSRKDDKADVYVRSLEQTVISSRFEIQLQGENIILETPLVGDYQGDNIGLATAIALSLGLTIENIQLGIQNLRNVPGRLESVDRGQEFSLFVDYAHTPEALNSALRTLRPLCRGSLTVVFGCGGDRDRQKRPMMGSRAADVADKVIITNDNPRSEDPEAISHEIIAGISGGNLLKVSVELDRRQAIRDAIETAKPGDVIVIAGKGAEAEQLIGDQRIVFDDREVAGEILEELLNDKAYA